MLKFFKKTGQKQNDTSNVITNSTPLEINPYTHTETLNGSPGYPKNTHFASYEDEGLFDIDEFQNARDQSSLSKTLGDVLSNKAALGYFVQFLESRGGLQYIRCWLDVDNFQAALQQYEDNKKLDHDSLSVSTDCDSYTADSSSIYDDSNLTISESKSSLKTPENSTNSITCDNRDSSESSPNKITQSSKYNQEFTDDALRIFKKYVALEAVDNVNCSEELRKETIENICCTDGKSVTDCFKNIKDFVFEVLDKEYFEAFMRSDYFCKYQIDVLTGGHVVLEDILYNETALFYFMEFLEQENNRNVLEFWLAATNFQQQLNDQRDFLDPVESQSDAVILYDKYFSLQALCPLGFGDKVRFVVEQNICGENGLTTDCFGLPLKIIEHVLEKHYLKSFLASQLFYKYLSELINTVQSVGYCIYEKNKVASECSSEKSFSTSSTFLAMEVPKNKKKHVSNSTCDMNIDTRELYDPDALWKQRKKRHSRLSFGRVTELGQFITDFEPEPDKKNQSMIKNVVKRFVNLDEDKKKEELAWQVAEMIVKSITSVTLTEQNT